jgi:hypothetical protein
MSETVKHTLTLNTGFVGAVYTKEIEVDASEYDNMTLEEQEEYLNMEAEEFIRERCYVSVKLVI